MLLTTIVLAASGLLTIEALPAEQHALVGEPVRVTLAWQTRETVDVHLRDR